jgi:hypothetical protein
MNVFIDGFKKEFKRSTSSIENNPNRSSIDQDTLAILNNFANSIDVKFEGLSKMIPSEARDKLTSFHLELESLVKNGSANSHFEKPLALLKNQIGLL